MEDTLKSLKERCKRTVLRKIETGEVTYDAVKKIFVYKDTDEEYKVDQKEGEDDSDEQESDADSNGQDDNSDENDGDDKLGKVKEDRSADKNDKN